MALISKIDCEKKDSTDPLAQFRQQFVIPEDVVYLDGNSLGARPVKALERAQEVVTKEWGERLIASWMEAGWFQLAETIGDKIAALIGANKGEVVVTDSTGIDLYKCVAAALKLQPDRKVIVMEADNFPTNNYMVQGLVRQLQAEHEIRFVSKAEIQDAINEDVAVVCLTHVHYKYGHILDMAAITKQAHSVGALTVWDLCHSAGAMPVMLNDCNVDFAVGCTYKYLNGGPGSPAFIFAAKRHHDKTEQPLTGWWGHAEPFAFERDYRPVSGIRQMLSGTQGILSMALVETGIDIFLQTDMQQLRDKSMVLTSLFIDLLEQELSEFSFVLASPKNPGERGSQVSISHEQGFSIMQALISRKVIGDFRAPDIMRFGFTPLYTRYIDVWNAVQRLREIMDTGIWQEAKYAKRGMVT